VACKLLPNWEKLCFLRPGGGSGTSSSYSIESNNDRPVGHDAKRCKRLEANGRFIPWTRNTFGWWREMVRSRKTISSSWKKNLSNPMTLYFPDLSRLYSTFRRSRRTTLTRRSLCNDKCCQLHKPTVLVEHYEGRRTRQWFEDGEANSKLLTWALCGSLLGL
jgi:hypothetical protein